MRNYGIGGHTTPCAQDAAIAAYRVVIKSRGAWVCLTSQRSWPWTVISLRPPDRSIQFKKSLTSICPMTSVEKTELNILFCSAENIRTRMGLVKFPPELQEHYYKYWKVDLWKQSHVNFYLQRRLRNKRVILTRPAHCRTAVTSSFWDVRQIQCQSRVA